MVRLEVLIGDVPGKAGKPAEAATKASTEDLRRQMEVVACGELTAVDNQPAFIRLGRREARITATTTGAMGTTNAITFENVGTSLGLVSRVAADGTVFVQLDVSDSHLGPPEEGPPIAVPSKGETIRTPNTETFSTQTTLHLRDGQTLVAGGMGWQAKSGKQRLVLVTAHVLDKGTTEGRDRPRQRE
jgi:type II secretory pathway component GspD/PulD (secretin)